MAGPITSLSLTDSGYGYTSAPTITISIPDLDSAVATATATVSAGGVVNAISLVDSGAYYTSIPDVTIGPPKSGIVDGASIATTGVSHINGQNYNTTGGSGTGLIIRSTSTGGLVSFTIVDGGKNYVVGDVVSTVLSNPEQAATINIDSTRAGTTATAIVSGTNRSDGGKLSSINVVLGGTDYDSAPSVTIDSASGTANDFRATASATIDSRGAVNALSITDIGGGYVTAPTITFSTAPRTNISQGDSATQTLSGGVKIRGEISKYSDSDGILHLVHVGADDGKYHTFAVGSDIVFSGPGSSPTYTREVLSVTEENKISANEQNDYFDTLTDFLDFSENNPFGEP